jgi:hypothetical protein
MNEQSVITIAKLAEICELSLDKINLVSLA